MKNAKLKNTLVLSNFDKSALISKYNYRFYNLKSINRISKKLSIDITNFQVFSSVLVYVIFIDTSYQTNILEICAQHKLSFKDVEKTMKLSLLFDNYEKLYTKKFQKSLLTAYSAFNIECSDDSD